MKRKYHIKRGKLKQFGKHCIWKSLKRALHLEAVTKMEEEEQTPKVAVIRRVETKDLVEAVTKLVKQLSVDEKQQENRRNKSRERISSPGRRDNDRCETRQ